ncbi:alcohol dehydrogenase [Conoideocrella luteorostrata]|uniref:alcohol dehydrogenase n=1 Tax=Conoideocrella luteorostrata TaxID=1105319 RepID=A0AAJ0CJT7_9HYPO|nr:alcohol dehydrogenase [Conoideocrella luteorostrata]
MTGNPHGAMGGSGGKDWRTYAIPVKKPGPDEVLANVKYSGVCHTDLHATLGNWPIPTKLPLVGDHEGAGVVVACGELVRDIEIGDHAGIKWLNGSCLNCSYCNSTDGPLCGKPLLSEYTAVGPFQQYAVEKTAHVARIPKECDLEAVSPILCAGITVYKGLKESGAIVGAGGGCGSFAIQYAKAMDLSVIAIDGVNEKKRMCKGLGANTFVDFQTFKDVIAEVKAANFDGLGPHAVILVAVQEKPFQQATQYVRARGFVVCIGLPPKAQLSAPVFDTVLCMINIKGSYVGNRADTVEALEFFHRGVIKAPFKTVGHSKLQDVCKLMHEGKIAGRCVVDTSK